ncbi:MAG: N-acetylmuramoyl-L-alanine amidase [Syntrophales bacterium]|nr:N-acetylmuramoyl-L-alanine amidase [Syntrophales bacterium]
MNIIKKLTIPASIIFAACFFGAFIHPAVAAEFKVVIDAGHGGEDPGVQLSRTVNEKDVTLAVAKMTGEILSRNKAIEVVLTRSEDKALSLDSRKEVIQSAEADLLVSIQVNAGFGTRASGYEVYFPSYAVPRNRENDHRKVIDEMIDMTNVNNSIRFSNIVDRELGRVFPREGRGVRSAPLAILDGISMPGVLIELGFATNIKNRDALLQKHTQEDIAKMIAESIRLYFGVPPA